MALFSHQPHGFYEALRWIVSCTLFVLAFVGWKEDGDWFYPALLAALAVVFNPVVPIRLPREVWLVLDGIALWFIALIGWDLKKHFKERNF